MSLNDTVWCKIGRSEIHGVGVIAIRDIPKGTKLHCYSNQREWLEGIPEDTLPEIRKLILERYPKAEQELHIYAHPNDDARLISFMNHSDNPNYDNETDTTLREIKKGEEVTEHYGACAWNW